MPSPRAHHTAAQAEAVRTTSPAKYLCAWAPSVKMKEQSIFRGQVFALSGKYLCGQYSVRQLSHEDVPALVYMLLKKLIAVLVGKLAVEAY